MRHCFVYAFAFVFVPLFNIAPNAQNGGLAPLGRSGPEGAIMVRVGPAPHGKVYGFTPGAGARESFKDCPYCPEMVVVPAGAFLMGSQDANSDDAPRHRVNIAHPFAVGKYAVSAGEWAVCRDAGYCPGEAADEAPGDGARGRNPINTVPFAYVQAYVNWLSHKTGHRYRLLSEAEREYVARAGSEDREARSIPPVEGEDQDGRWTYGDGGSRAWLVAAGPQRPNPWGLYQARGNGWEWVEDCWHHNYVGAPSDGRAWLTEDCSRRVVRGGSGNGALLGLRSASRYWLWGDRLDRHASFRVARSMDNESAMVLD
jgi:formylglycine-generating enzyme required for sulfatase activity